MSNVVLPAIITAIASLIVAVISVLVTARTSRRVARLADELEKQRLHLASELEEQRAVRDARRDYEYEARKRLYQECEPLLFEAAELAELARYRVVSVARSCRQGKLLPNGSGWLADPRDYYFRSTVFYLLAPMTSFKIIQQRLTVIDLSLEPRLQTQYELLKLLFVSFTEAHELAERGPALTYDPRSRPQGFLLGTLEVATEAMIDSRFKENGDEVARCRSFGEFLSQLDDDASALKPLVPAFSDLFRGFHPQRQPVLWRILIMQVLLYDAFLSAYRSVETDGRLVRLVSLPPREQLALFDWRTDAGQADDTMVREPFVVARDYLRDKIARLERTLPRNRSTQTEPRAFGAP